jgi:phosphinothricin acetyltransferase
MIGIEIRTLTADDWDPVRSVYLDGLATGQATFETQAPSWTEWNHAHLSIPRLVATSEDRVLGWAALSPVSSRAVYAGVAEVSVYVDKDSRGKGIGKALFGALIAESEKNGIWTLQASIFPENVASIALHKAWDFCVVGRRERIGKRNGVWRDTILFERRSKLVGIE